MKQAKQSFEFDYEAVKNRALSQLKPGKPLLGKEGALGPLCKSFLEAALEADLDSHLQENKDEDSNRRNVHGSKQLRTSEGTMERNMLHIKLNPTVSASHTKDKINY